MIDPHIKIVPGEPTDEIIKAAIAASPTPLKESKND